MINRYEGNTGRVVRLPEEHDLPLRPPERPEKTLYRPERAPHRPERPPKRPLLRGLGLDRLLPGLGEGLETEDLLLLLILYLLYRESGDSELLIIMGALFLL